MRCARQRTCASIARNLDRSYGVVGRTRALVASCAACFFLLGVCRFVVAGLGRRANETGQVVEIQSFGSQVCAQERALVAQVDFCSAGKIAVAGSAGELFIAPDIAIAAQAAVQLVRGRRWHRDADQRIEVFHILAAERHLQVEHPELEWIGQRAAHMRPRGARAAAQIDAERMFALAQFQRRGGVALEREWIAFPAALTVDADRCGALVAAGRCQAVDGHIHIRAGGIVDILQPPVGNQQAAQARHAAVAIALVEDPVTGMAVVAGFQQQRGVLQPDLRQPQLAAQQWPEFDIDLCRIQFCHCAALGPRCIAQAQSLATHRGDAAQIDIQMTKMKFAPGLRTDCAFHRPA